MSFESITSKIRGARGRAKGTGHPALLTVMVRPGCRTKTGRSVYRDRLRFRLVKELADQAEWEPGQKVEVLFDRERMLAMIVLSDHGYSLSASMTRGNNYDLSFHVPHDPQTGFPLFFNQTGMEDVEVKDGQIHFRVPVPGNPSFVSTGKAHQGNGEYQQELKGKKIPKEKPCSDRPGRGPTRH